MEEKKPEPRVGKPRQLRRKDNKGKNSSGKVLMTVTSRKTGDGKLTNTNTKTRQPLTHMNYRYTKISA